MKKFEFTINEENGQLELNDKFKSFVSLAKEISACLKNGFTVSEINGLYEKENKVKTKLKKKKTKRGKTSYVFSLN